MPEFEGTSDKQDVQEALNKAVERAASSISDKIKDGEVTYTVKRISGIQGGFAGWQKISVVIDATFPAIP